MADRGTSVKPVAQSDSKEEIFVFNYQVAALASMEQDLLKSTYLKKTALYNNEKVIYDRETLKSNTLAEVFYYAAVIMLMRHFLFDIYSIYLDIKILCK